MEEYFDEEGWGEGDEMDAMDDFEPMDPFEGLNKRDQDLFFRVLDMVPDEQREGAIDYFMSNPSKIHAVIENVKTKKELIENKDVEGLKQLFEQERVMLDEYIQELQRQQSGEDGYGDI